MAKRPSSPNAVLFQYPLGREGSVVKSGVKYVPEQTSCTANLSLENNKVIHINQSSKLAPSKLEGSQSRFELRPLNHVDRNYIPQDPHNQSIVQSDPSRRPSIPRDSSNSIGLPPKIVLGFGEGIWLLSPTIAQIVNSMGLETALRHHRESMIGSPSYYIFS